MSQRQHFDHAWQDESLVVEACKGSTSDVPLEHLMSFAAEYLLFGEDLEFFLEYDFLVEIEVEVGHRFADDRSSALFVFRAVGELHRVNFTSNPAKLR